MRSFFEHYQYRLGDMIADYLVDQDRQVELMIYPAERADQVTVPTNQKTTVSLVQAKLAGAAVDKNFTNGLTMFNSATTQSLRLVGQQADTTADGRQTITTTLRDDQGSTYQHYLAWQPGQQRLKVWTAFINGRPTTQRLVWLASFCLSGVSPFYGDQMPAGTLDLIRLRSKWAMEGRIEERPIEDYDLETSWKPSGLALEQFGQNGTMPVRRFFPYVGLRDRAADVTWLAELAGQASWQLNVSRLDDRLAIFGGLPDADNGQWFTDIAPDKDYTSPYAYLTVGTGDLLTVSRRLQTPIKTTELPIIYNEWGTSWGNPSADLVHESVALLQDHHVDCYVIDAGWYDSPDGNWDGGHGDWLVDVDRFPAGMAPVVQDVHAHGMQAGIWYEYETVGRNSTKSADTEALVKRDGIPVTTMKRRFLDLTQPAVQTYLRERMVQHLVTSSFDYLKVDYNDSAGIGAAGIGGATSPAEGLQRLTDAALAMLQEVRQAVPGITIENCASGGHRLTPTWIDATDVSSFSDAHETHSIPIIAANELNVIPAAKNLIWCVVHPEESPDELYFHLIATFLGRVCLSGDIRQLQPSQWQIIDQCLAFYQHYAALIAQGAPFREGPAVLSYHDPVGYQISGFKQDKQMLVLVFGYNLPARRFVNLDIPTGWRLTDVVGSTAIQRTDQGRVSIAPHIFAARAFVFAPTA